MSTCLNILTSIQWIKYILVGEETVLGEASPSYWGAGKGKEFWEAWNTQERKYAGQGLR